MRVVLRLALASLPLGCAAPSIAETPAELAFVGVHVVPMDRDHVLRDQTVVVGGGRILRVGPKASTTVPDNALRILGRGRYLVPGLCDMHVHLRDERYLLLFVAHGVTTVRNMWGERDTLALRRKVSDGGLGPRIYTTGPLLDGSTRRWQAATVLRTPAEARPEVERQKRLGYDAIKVYDDLSKGVYGAILAAAKRADMRVVGHVPLSVDLYNVLAGGQRSIEHFRGYPRAMLDKSVPLAVFPQARGFRELPDRTTTLRSLVDATLRNGVWNCPTLVVNRAPYAALRNLQAAWRHPAMKFVPKETRALWDPARDARFAGQSTLTDEEWRLYLQWEGVLTELLATLDQKNAGLLIGTDTPNPFVVPGYSVHQEMAIWQDAGLRPYRVLRAATAAAADFLGSKEFGRLEVGARADMVLVEADPLEDVRNLRKIAGVVLRGRWLSGMALQRRTSALIESYDARPDWLAGLQAPGSRPHHSFDVSWNGQPIGAARVIWAATGQPALVQLAERRTSLDRLEARRSLNDTGQELSLRCIWGTRTGDLSVTCSKQGRLHAKGRLPDGTAIDTHLQAVPNCTLASGLLSHLIALAPKFRALPVGEHADFELCTPELEAGGFEISRTSLRVTRRADPRTFGIRLRAGERRTRGHLVLDANGLPTEAGLIFGQGQKLFRRR